MPNELRPTVVLGVGSFGSKVASRLRTLVFEELGVPGLPIFSFISLSTHDNHENVEIDPPHSNFSPSWQRLIQLEAFASTDVKSRLKSVLGEGPLAAQQPGWRDWLDPKLTDLAMQTYNAGAGGVRMIGRSLLWLNWIDGGEIKPKLDQAINRVVDPKSALEADNLLARYQHRKTGAPVAAGIPFVKRGQPNVFIITSLCGGTGSGMFLDLAYYFRNHHPAAKIFGLFSVPDIPACGAMGKHNVVVNAFAALSELDFYMRDSTMFDFRFPGENQHYYTNEMPYDSVRLVSPSSRQDRGGFRLYGDEDTSFITEMEHICATSLFFDLISGADSAKAGLLVDFPRRLSGFLEPKSNHPHRVRFLSAMGTATAQYPKYRVAGAAACQLIQEKLSHWNGLNMEPTPPERLQELAAQWHKDALRDCLARVQGEGAEDINQEWQLDFDGSCTQAVALPNREFSKFRDALEKCPSQDPVSRRFLSGGVYHKKLEMRQSSYQTALVSNLRNRIAGALADLSSGKETGGGVIANLNDLIDVVSQLISDLKRSAANLAPAPAEPVTLQGGVRAELLREISDTARQDGQPSLIQEMEDVDNSFAAMLLFKRGKVRNFYLAKLQEMRKSVLGQFRNLLQKNYRRLVSSVTKKPRENAAIALDQELKTLTRIRSNLNSYLSHVTRRNEDLQHIPATNNLIFLFPSNGNLGREIKTCASTWRPDDWNDVLNLVMAQRNEDKGFLWGAAADSQGENYTLLQQLLSQVMSLLVGRMDLRAMGFSLSNELTATGAGVRGLADRSEVLLELDPAYPGWAGAPMPRLVVGGTHHDQDNVVANLNAFNHAGNGNNDLYDYMDHMLHLYQEEVGLAMDDLAIYHGAESLYRQALSSSSPLQGIVHTHKDPRYFSIDIYMNLRRLLTDKPNQPSPVSIITCLRPVRAVVLHGEEYNQYFTWEEEGLPETVQFNLDDVWAFAGELARSTEGTNIFLDTVRDAIFVDHLTPSELQPMFEEGREAWNTVPTPEGKHRWTFDELFTKEFVHRKNYPWF